MFVLEIDMASLYIYDLICQIYTTYEILSYKVISSFLGINSVLGQFNGFFFAITRKGVLLRKVLYSNREIRKLLSACELLGRQIINSKRTITSVQTCLWQ